MACTPLPWTTNYFNFLWAAHEGDPLPVEGPVGISHPYNGHLNGYAGHFTDSVVQRIREVPEVAYVEQDSIDTPRHSALRTMGMSLNFALVSWLVMTPSLRVLPVPLILALELSLSTTTTQLVMRVFVCTHRYQYQHPSC